MGKSIEDQIHEWAQAGDLTALQDYKAEHRPEDLAVQNDFEETPLITALKYGQKQVVDFLMVHSPVDVYQRCPAYMTPLVAAVYFGNIDAVRQLIAIEKELKGCFDPKQHPGLLLTAVRKDSTELVEYLIQEGVDINCSGSDNFDEGERDGFDQVYCDSTPFDAYGPPVFDLPVIVALQDEKTNALRVLLNHGADLDKKRPWGTYSAKQLIQSNEKKRKVYEQSGGRLDKLNGLSLTAYPSSQSFFGQKVAQPSLHALLEQLHSSSIPASEKEQVLDRCHILGVKLVRVLGKGSTSEKEQLLELVNVLSEMLKEYLHSSNNAQAATPNGWDLLVETTTVPL